MVAADQRVKDKNTKKPNTKTETPKPALTKKAYELLSYLRCHKSIFFPGQGFNSTTVALTLKNDTGRCLIPEEEIETNRVHLPGATALKIILEKQEELVGKAWGVIEEKQGGLSEEVEKILKYDLEVFLRVISYAVGANCRNYIARNNFEMAKMLYDELGVGHTVMADAIEAMKMGLMNELDEEESKTKVDKVFGVVIDDLRK